MSAATPQTHTILCQWCGFLALPLLSSLTVHRLRLELHSTTLLSALPGDHLAQSLALTSTLRAGKPVDVVAIDHLPTLLPLESSQRYAADLLPTFKTLPEVQSPIRTLDNFATARLQPCLAKSHQAVQRKGGSSSSICLSVSAENVLI